MEDKGKLVQLTIVFSLFSKGKSMTNYEGFQPSYEFLKFRSNPKKRWSNGAGWEIVEHIQNEVIKVTKLAVQNSNFIFLTCDEVVTMDKASWASVRGYIVQDWCWTPLLN